MDGQFPDFKKSALQYLQCTTGLGNGSCAVGALGNMEDPVSQGGQLQGGCDLFFGYVQVCGKLFCNRHWAYIPEKQPGKQIPGLDSLPEGSAECGCLARNEQGRRTLRAPKAVQ